ncbi:putative urea ABC transporter substrate-binding protein [Shewanella sp. NIFS-20-20]|uniref:putative urea ABC transporter substrate-binding protein n=1 Tax=Shewanella sp. NIFS-20-20 TaxID=2853806 RepID=UPI001C47421F|nr:putative urea ABC transporter substrate-binding protein [Shewanella sp. NIFS-20-20]MBV7314158.1 putative urea ABC transporter substrate-binding protein [Shewanella sp. NIFS-20-20]
MKLSYWLIALIFVSATSSAKDTFNVCWSHYIGWEPWYHAEKSGILTKWAERYRIKINLQRIDDYLDSVQRFSAGEFDACTMTQIDALTIPAASGIDTTAIIIGDYSNGNDGIATQAVTQLSQLKGQDIRLVSYSVSHYLLARALSSVGLTEDDVNIIDSAEDSLLEYWQQHNDATIVTWTPLLQQALSVKGQLLFDSSSMHTEILDLMVVHTDSDDRLKHALTGAWYEVMAQLKHRNTDVYKNIAQSANISLVEVYRYYEGTKMFYSAATAARVANSRALKKTMKLVNQFGLKHGLLDANAPIGIAFPQGQVEGDASNIKFRFDSRFMEWFAAEENAAPE